MKQKEIDMITNMVINLGKPAEFKISGPPSVQKQKRQKPNSALNRHQRRSRNKMRGYFNRND